MHCTSAGYRAPAVPHWSHAVAGSSFFDRNNARGDARDLRVCFRTVTIGEGESGAIVETSTEGIRGPEDREINTVVGVLKPIVNEYGERGSNNSSIIGFSSLDDVIIG